MSDKTRLDRPEEEKCFGATETFNCKAILNKETVPLFGKEWKRARRSVLKMDLHGFSFDDTLIPYEKVNQLTLRVFESAFFVKCCVITLKGEGFSHHFAMKYSAFWERELPVTIETVEEETPFLMVRKAIMVLIITYIFIELIR